VNLHIFAVTMHVNHHLSGLANAVQGHAGVSVRVQGKPGYGVQLEQEGAHHPEKITHHGVGGPGIEQFAQAVAHVKRTAAVLFNQVPNPAGKALKTAKRVNADGLNGGVLVINDRRVFAKTEINNLTTRTGGSINKRKDEAAIVVQVGNAPDYVVADSEVIKNLVQPGEAGGYPVFGLERLVTTHCRIR
jgi:hypothetical protein